MDRYVLHPHTIPAGLDRPAREIAASVVFESRLFGTIAHPHVEDGVACVRFEKDERASRRRDLAPAAQSGHRIVEVVNEIDTAHDIEPFGEAASCLGVVVL